MAGDEKSRGSRGLVAAAVILVALTIWALLGLEPILLSGEVDYHLLQATVEGLGALMGLLVGVLLGVHGHITGTMWTGTVGAAMMLLGGVTIGLTTLLPLVDPRSGAIEVIELLRPGSRVAVLALFVMAASAASGRASGRWLSGIFVGVALTAVTTLVFQFVPPLAAALRGAADLLPSGAPTSLWSGPLLLVLAWFTLGLVFGTLTLRSGDPLLGWVALLLVALGVAEQARTMELIGGGSWSFHGSVLRLVGMSFALVGVLAALLRVFQSQRGHLQQTSSARDLAEPETSRSGTRSSCTRPATQWPGSRRPCAPWRRVLRSSSRTCARASPMRPSPSCGGWRC